MKLSLENNVNNFLTKGNHLMCLRESYRKFGKAYLGGIITGLAAFLRLQGHAQEEWIEGIDYAINLITDGKETEASLREFLNA